MGSGQPLKKPIIVEHDTTEFHIGRFGYNRIELDKLLKDMDPTQFPATLEPMPIEEEIELTLSEALRVIEATVKYLNQTKDEGRHEIRTIKDKENQKIVDELKKQFCNLDISSVTTTISYALANLVKQAIGKNIKDL